MGFGNKFNKWLIEQGKEPLTDEEIKIYNESGKRVGKQMLKDKDKICKDLGTMLNNLKKISKKRGK